MCVCVFGNIYAKCTTRAVFKTLLIIIIDVSSFEMDTAHHRVLNCTLSCFNPGSSIFSGTFTNIWNVFLGSFTTLNNNMVGLL